MFNTLLTVGSFRVMYYFIKNVNLHNLHESTDVLFVAECIRMTLLKRFK